MSPPPAVSPPPPPEAQSSQRGLRAKLGKHRDKITVVVLGQVTTVLGLALGSRVLTEFVTPAALGEYKLAIGIVGFFSALFFRPFIQFVMRHYHDAVERKEEWSFLAFARRAVRNGALVLGAALAITLLWYGRKTSGIGWIAAVTSIGLLYLHVALSFQHGVLVTQNRQKSAVLIRTSMQCATPLALAAGAYVLGQSGQILLFSEFILLSLILGTSALWMKESGPIAASTLPKERSREWTKDGAHFVVPLLSVSLFSWTLGIADRFILAAYHSPHEVGLYTAVYGLGSQPMLMMSGMMAQLIFPILFKAAAQQRAESQVRALRYALGSAAIASALGMAALIVFGGQIIDLLLAKPYRENAMPLLIWVAAGYSLLGIASSFELKAYAGKRTVVISIAYGIAALVNLGLNLLWIPSDGSLGAARATFFGYMAYLMSIVFISRKLRAVQSAPCNK